jgi:hypothetical protein
LWWGYEDAIQLKLLQVIVMISRDDRHLGFLLAWLYYKHFASLRTARKMSTSFPLAVRLTRCRASHRAAAAMNAAG